MAQFDISVLITTRDRREILEETVTRLFRSTHVPLEVVILDDGSVDGTLQMLRSLAPPPGVTLRAIRAEATGVGHGFNTAAQASTGKYLLFLGDDAFCPPELIAGHVALHEKLDDPLVAVSGRIVWSPGLPPSRFRDWLGDGIIHQHPDLPEGGFAPNRHFFTLNASIHRTLWEKVGGLPEDIPWWIDTIFAYRAARHGMRLYFAPDLVVEHHHDWTEESFCLRRFKKGQIAREFLRVEPAFEEFVEVPKPTLRRTVMGTLSRLLYPVARALHLNRLENWYFSHRVSGSFAKGYAAGKGS